MMVMPIHPRSAVTRPTAMACMTWPAMSGNGRPTGMTPIRAIRSVIQNIKKSIVFCGAAPGTTIRSTFVSRIAYVSAPTSGTTTSEFVVPVHPLRNVMKNPTNGTKLNLTNRQKRRLRVRKFRQLAAGALCTLPVSACFENDYTIKAFICTSYAGVGMIVRQLSRISDNLKMRVVSLLGAVSS